MAAPVPAQLRPLPADEQQAVNRAIDLGVDYLKRTQQKNGTWAAAKKPENFPVGYAALPGLTLLECGVPADDPVVQQAARLVRSRAAAIDRTYELSLAILFLDRLGDPKDQKIIQALSLRLIAGQSATGGWGYKCPLLNDRVQMELLTALRRLDPPAGGMPALARRPGKKPDQLQRTARTAGAQPPQGAIARPAAPPLSDSVSRGSPGESRSSQDANASTPSRGNSSPSLDDIDGKDAKNREAAPKEPSEQKPLETKPDGKAGDGKPPDAKEAQRKSPKPFVIPERLKQLPVMKDPAMHILKDPEGKAREIILTTTDNSNTQFAILALWKAQGHDVPTKRSLNLIVRRYQTSQNADGSWGYHYRFGGGEHKQTLSMTCVGLIGLAVGHALEQPQPAGPPVQDPRIINGLLALSKNVGQPVEHADALPMQNLYFLWSLERVAVLYDLPVIGEKDWYRWGAQVLVRNQEDRGNWTNGRYHGSSTEIDTCFSLLFLRRANLVKDLAAKLPFKAADLNKGIAEKLAPDEPAAKLTKKSLPSVEPSKPAQLDKSITAAKSTELNKPIAAETPAPLDEPSESRGSKRGWIVVSLVLFVIFAGGSLFFLFSARRRGENGGEAKDDKPRKRTNKRKPRSTS